MVLNLVRFELAKIGWIKLKSRYNAYSNGANNSILIRRLIVYVNGHIIILTGSVQVTIDTKHYSLS